MSRPLKPRIAKPRLKWVWRPAKGVWEPQYRITWTDSGKRRERSITLDWEDDPEKLDRLYWQSKAGRHESQAAPARYTWRECIIAWRKDPRIQGRLADSTKRSYRPPMDDIVGKNGDKDMRKTTRPAIRAAHDKLSKTPRKADRALQTGSLLWNYASKKLDWPLGENPFSGIDHFGKQREFLPWPEWMVKALGTAPERVQTAAQLILGTGQRPNAAINMRREHFRGEWMIVRDEKGDDDFEVFCPDRLRKYVDSLPRTGAYVLAKNLTEPAGYDAVEKAFRKWRESLGEEAKKFVLHGLRKLAIIELAEAGATDAQIQAVTGQSAEMVAYYRANANRKELSRAGQELRK